MSDSNRTATPLPTLDCGNCGVCCLHMGYPSYVTGNESQPAESHWIDMPKDLKLELLSYIENYDAPSGGELDGPCCWYDPATRRCKHHQHRPNVCRSFVAGGQGCLDWREHYRDRIV